MPSPLGRTAAVLFLGVAATAALACHGRRCDTTPCGPVARPAPLVAAPAAPAAPVAPAATAFDAQAARGQDAYARFCATCHGGAGQGSKNAPPLVGAGALPLARPGARVRTMEFRTAGDVGRFAAANMPPMGPKPGADEAWAIVAFALKANGVTRAEAVSPANADGIVLHP